MDFGKGAELFIDSQLVGNILRLEQKNDGYIIDIEGSLLAALVLATAGPHDFKMSLPISGAPIYKKSMILLSSTAGMPIDGSRPRLRWHLAPI